MIVIIDDMSRHPIQLGLFQITLTIATVIAVFVLLPRPGGAESSKSANCVSWTQEAKFVGYAYNHLVHLRNQCAQPVTCSVKTDVNPKPQTVALDKGAQKTVLTFRGSPAKTFRATVTCEMR